MRGVFDREGKPFKCDVAGNDKEYGFNVPNDDSSELDHEKYPEVTQKLRFEPVDGLLNMEEEKVLTTIRVIQTMIYSVWQSKFLLRDFSRTSALLMHHSTFSITKKGITIQKLLTWAAVHELWVITMIRQKK